MGKNVMGWFVRQKLEELSAEQGASQELSPSFVAVLEFGSWFPSQAAGARASSQTSQALFSGHLSESPL